MTTMSITNKYSRSDPEAIIARITSGNRPGSKAFADDVAEFEKANGYPVGTFHYRIDYRSKSIGRPVSFKRNFANR